MSRDIFDRYSELWPVYVAEVDAYNAEMAEQDKEYAQSVQQRQRDDQQGYDRLPFYKKWGRQDPRGKYYRYHDLLPRWQPTVDDFLVWAARRETEG